MNRREFLYAGCSSLSVGINAASDRRADLSAKASLYVDLEKELSVMPVDFTGLSYESAQLENPEFFGGDNTSLVEKFRNLGREGVLRIGGNLSDYTYWVDTKPSAPTAAQQSTAEQIREAYEWRLVDSAAAKARFTVITPAAVRSLRTFLDTTGWRLLYGLNLGSGTAERAVEEAAVVYETIGSRLIAFQVGNEDDFFAPRHRPQPYTFDEYWTEYQAFVRAIRQRIPAARFAGPDVAARMDWVKQYAIRAKGDAVLLTGHYYAMGPAGDPTMTAERLLSQDSKLRSQVQQALEDAKIAGVPFRMTEGNSCFHGGQPGVSHAFASALWCADYMLFLARSGYAGVNLHGGGDGTYSPIVGDRQRGFSAKPLYYGMQFAERLAGYTFLGSQLDAGDTNATAYVGKRNGGLAIAFLNKEPRALAITLDSQIAVNGKIHMSRLTGPSLDSKTGVSLSQEEISRAEIRTVNIAPYSGVILVWDNVRRSAPLARRVIDLVA